MKNLFLVLILLSLLSSCDDDMVQYHASPILTEEYSDPIFCEEGFIYAVETKGEETVEGILTFMNGNEVSITFSNGESHLHKKINKKDAGSFYLSLRRQSGSDPLPVLIRRTRSGGAGVTMLNNSTWISGLKSPIGTKGAWWILLALTIPAILVILFTLSLYPLTIDRDIFGKRVNFTLRGIGFPSILLSIFEEKWFEDEEDSSYDNEYLGSLPAVAKKLFGDKTLVGPSRFRILLGYVKIGLLIIIVSLASIAFLFLIWPIGKWLVFWTLAWIDSIFVLDKDTISPILTNNKEWITLLILLVGLFRISKESWSRFKGKYLQKLGFTNEPNTISIPYIFGKRSKLFVLLEGVYDEVLSPVFLSFKKVDLDWKILEIKLEGEVNTADPPESGKQWEVYGLIYIYVRIYDGYKALGYEGKNSDLTGKDNLLETSAVHLMKGLASGSINVAVSSSQATEVDDNPKRIERRIFENLKKAKDKGRNPHFEPGHSPVSVLKHIPSGWLIGDIICPGFTFSPKVREATQKAIIAQLEAITEAAKIKTFKDNFKEDLKFNKLTAPEQNEFILIALGYVPKEISERRYSIDFPDSIKDMIKNLTPTELSALVWAFSERAKSGDSKASKAGGKTPRKPAGSKKPGGPKS